MAISAKQVRMARAALDWSIREFATNARISTDSVSMAENDAIGPGQKTWFSIQTTLEENGIEFLTELDAICLHSLDDLNKAAITINPNMPTGLSRIYPHKFNKDLTMNSNEVQLFTIQRFQVVSHFKQAKDESNNLDPGYVYAWSESVYPILHESAKWHEPFKSSFKITEEAMDELYDFFGDCLDADRSLTFYDLESHYKRNGSQVLGYTWSRPNLIKACRYIYLSDSLNDDFWGTLLTNGQCPIEAFSISRPFKGKEIYFL